jgi:lipoprotein-releasing system permease protein
MGGFSNDLKRKILGNNAHIVIDQESAAPWADWQEVLDHARLVPGVVAATPVVQSEVMVSSPSNLAGVIVRGVDPGSIGNVIELTKDIEVGKFEFLEKPDELRHLPPDTVIGIGPGGEQYLKGADLPGLPDDIDPAVKEALSVIPMRPGIIIGRELARTLHVYVGDEVTLVSPLGDLGPMGVMPRTKKFRVAAIFFSGMYEYDASHVYITLDDAQQYFATDGKIGLVEVKSEDPEHVEEVTSRLRAAIARPDLRVRDWREMNKNLFSALKLERFATFIILSVAIMVASFCIICTLLLMVTEKGKEIAILKAIGASDSDILRTFMTEGVIIGTIGTIFGVATALALCAGLSWFGLRLDPDVYYIDRLPIAVNASDFAAVALAAITICTIATIYPAYAASTLRPVDGLRHE